MSEARNSFDRWFNRLNNFWTVAGPGGLVILLLGLFGGLFDRISKFPPLWRNLTYLGALVVAVWVVLIMVRIGRAVLARRHHTDASDVPSGLPSITGVSVDRSPQSSVWATSVRVGQSRVKHVPLVLDENRLRLLQHELGEVSAGVLELARKNRAGMRAVDEGSLRQALEQQGGTATDTWNAEMAERDRVRADTQDDYERRFGGRARALVSLAADNGFVDEELTHFVEGPGGWWHEIGLGLGSLAEQIRIVLSEPTEPITPQQAPDTGGDRPESEQ
jgi:hypothetical protein